eukprot:Sdes_comp18544_c0_seq2m8624
MTELDHNFYQNSRKDSGDSRYDVLNQTLTNSRLQTSSQLSDLQGLLVKAKQKYVALEQTAFIQLRMAILEERKEKWKTLQELKDLMQQQYEKVLRKQELSHQKKYSLLVEKYQKWVDDASTQDASLSEKKKVLMLSTILTWNLHHWFCNLWQNLWKNGKCQKQCNG